MRKESICCVLLLAIALLVPGCKKRGSALTPKDAIAVFDKATIENNESIFNQVYYAGEDEVIGDLIKKDFLAHSRFANKLHELQGYKSFQKLTKSEIETAIENAFTDRSILYVMLSPPNAPPDVIKESIKGMRLARTLPSERILLLQKRGEQWFIVHPYIAWNRGFQDKDKAFLKDRILLFDKLIRDIEVGEKTAEQIAHDYKELVSALKTIHNISPFQW